MIYFAATPTGSIKIGCTGDIKTRFGALRAIYGAELNLLATMEGGREREAEIHARFKRHRIGRTEQFRPAPALMAFIGKPLLVGANPDAVLAAPIAERELERATIVNIKGSPEYAEWLEAIHRKTHIPRVQIFRLAVAAWAEENGHEAPPEI